MKDILTRLFNHEELTSEETKQILLNITREKYSEAQIAALLTVFQMRSITVDELTGFRRSPYGDSRPHRLRALPSH